MLSTYHTLLSYNIYMNTAFILDYHKDKFQILRNFLVALANNARQFQVSFQ